MEADGKTCLYCPTTFNVIIDSAAICDQFDGHRTQPPVIVCLPPRYRWLYTQLYLTTLSDACCRMVIDSAKSNSAVNELRDVFKWIVCQLSFLFLYKRNQVNLIRKFSLMTKTEVMIGGKYWMIQFSFMLHLGSFEEIHVRLELKQHKTDENVTIRSRNYSGRGCCWDFRPSHFPTGF